MNDELTLEDLVNISGLPIRTVRFYIQEGLLPGPDSRGKNARYTEEHLNVWNGYNGLRSIIAHYGKFASC